MKNFIWLKSYIITGICLAGTFLFLFTARAEEPSTVSVDALKASINDVLENEQKNIDNLKVLQDEAENLKKAVLAEINAYKIQLPIYNNLLLQFKEASLKDLERAWLETRTHSEDINKKINELKTKQDGMAPLLNQAREQLAVTEKQVVEILSDITLKKEAAALTGRYKKLVAVLKDKEKIFKKIEGTYADMVTPLQETRQGFNDLSDKLNEAIALKKKENLLERQNFMNSIGFKQLLTDATSALEQIQAVTSPGNWKNQPALEFVRKSGGILLVSFVLLLGMVLVLTYRVRIMLARALDAPWISERFWNRLTLRLVRQSLFLLTITLFLYVYDQSGPFQSNIPILSLILNILVIWLFSRWWRDAVDLYFAKEGPLPAWKPDRYLRLLIRVSKWFAIGSALVIWLNGSGSSLLIVWRVIFGISLYAWTACVWKDLDRHIASGAVNWHAKAKAGQTSIKSIGYAVLLAGFMLELTGYGLLAQYWYASWGRTLVAALWCGLVFMAIREWDPKAAGPRDPVSEPSDKSGHSIRWVMVRMAQVVWFAVAIVLLVFSWGGKQAVLVGILNFLRHTFQVGGMRFSLMGLLVAIVIILLTQALSRVWQHVFRKKVLKQSGMEEGLQDSVVTISVYVIWSVGILFALNAVGFTATSLTVVMGALGVGLGFGLQAIFNNFISGIILLFERPIQVGDDIEVGGVWATVKEINVRSTIVQTYDNASLIIPNSDLISSQVTNWSFKDKRIRRTVEIGVAYGSDVELVRKALLEVAEKTSRVLKLPKPDVIFKHFGDNALIFLLRFWTRLEYFLAVESDVRFEIDRLFREHNIEIAFPQMDIHVRSGLDAVKKTVDTE